MQASLGVSRAGWAQQPSIMCDGITYTFKADKAQDILRRQSWRACEQLASMPYRRHRRCLSLLLLLALISLWVVSARWHPLIRQLNARSQLSTGVHVDSDILDLVLNRFLSGEQDALRTEMIHGVEAARDAVSASVLDVTGVNVALHDLALELTTPGAHVTAARWASGTGFSGEVDALSFVDLDVHVNMGFKVDSQCNIDIPAEVDRHGLVPRAFHAVLRTTAQVVMPATNCRNGTCSHSLDMNTQIAGQLAGPVRLRARLDMSNLMPRLEQTMLLDASRLRVKLSEYSLSPDRGLVAWIRRLNLLPMGLLEHVANVELQKAVVPAAAMRPAPVM
mmetsp:Transcript_55802/g.103259  ORF Transcript_55802/g.103259 Transcript_55802/m.103259 type:complete len:335 (+) Transcript_55802:48-1052(+)